MVERNDLLQVLRQRTLQNPFASPHTILLISHDRLVVVGHGRRLPVGSRI